VTPRGRGKAPNEKGWRPCGRHPFACRRAPCPWRPSKRPAFVSAGQKTERIRLRL
jgi:hypothetical protein